ncbi:methyl-accepting chemotaxis protein [Gammaproteobacteria bacterium]
MPMNMPVTTTEREVRRDARIVSRTDLEGIITYVNDEFVAISGFAEKELLGAPHSIVRHPDMPKAAFADLWVTIQRGDPWSGLVKNRCKNGDYYWVEANVMPIREKGRTVGYMSVRTRPSRAQVDEAERHYAALRAGRSDRFGLFTRMTNSLRHIGLRGRIMTGLGLFIFFKLAMIGFLPTEYAEIGKYADIGALGLLALLTWLALRATQRALTTALRHCEEMTNGCFDQRIEAKGRDEIARLMLALKSMQIKLAFDMNDARRQTDAALRVQTALDNVSTNVMIADPDGNLIYLNRAVIEMMAHAEADIRKDLPRFTARDLVGRNIDEFHVNPAHQRLLLKNLHANYEAHLTIGGRNFDLVANPVFNAQGVRLGSVVEWTDCTEMKRVQNEVKEMVNTAQAGDLTRRIDLAGKDGFLRNLAESLNQLLETVEGAVSDTVNALECMARGDLTIRINNTYGGEFARIRENTNITTQQLGTLAGDIRSAAEAINSASREISIGNMDLSKRTEQQAASLEETGATMEELTSTVKQNASNASQANQFAQGARDVAERGGELVGQVVRTMSAITESSTKIADIISVIEGIAFQTNILALNAAVEAARAGEQGRGFSVVAAEVRSLAGRSATAAKEIKSLIDASTTQVNNGSRLVGQAGQTMGDIVQAVKRVTDLMAEISAASNEQSKGIEQVNQAISQMDEVTQQNAALVEEAASASESLQEQAEQLLTAVSKFKLEENTSVAKNPSSQSSFPPVEKLEKSGKSLKSQELSTRATPPPTVAKPATARIPAKATPQPSRTRPSSVMKMGKNQELSVRGNEDNWKEF